METRADIQSVPSRRATLLRCLVFLAVLMLIGGFYLLGGRRYLVFDYLRRNLDVLEARVQANLLLAIVLFTVIYIVLVALSLPVSAGLTILAGALFGRWLGTGVASFSATVGATLAFLSSRYLFRGWIDQKWGHRLKPLQRGLERDGGYYLFVMRIVAVVPYFLINLGMGVTRIRTWKFIWVSWLGMLPVGFLYANAGTEFRQIESPKDVLSPSLIVSLAAIGLFPLLVRFALRRLVGSRGRTGSPFPQRKSACEFKSVACLSQHRALLPIP